MPRIAARSDIILACMCTQRRNWRADGGHVPKICLKLGIRSRNLRLRQVRAMPDRQRQWVCHPAENLGDVAGGNKGASEGRCGLYHAAGSDFDQRSLVLIGRK